MNGHDTKILGDTEAHLLLTLASQDKQVFTTADANAVLGGKQHRVNKVIARLSNKRWILRLRRGLFMILPFEAGIDGTYSIHPFRIVPYLVKPYAIAYWTALHYYGYTEQIPSITFVATTTKPTSTELTIQELGLTYRFVSLAFFKFFGHQKIWIDAHETCITDRAKTLVDCLDHPEYCGGIVEAAQGFYESVTKGDVTPQLLTQYAERMRNRTIFKRMGYLAELLDLPVGAEIDNWRISRSTGFSLLDPLAGDHGPHNSHWQLRLNRTPADLTDWLAH